MNAINRIVFIIISVLSTGIIYAQANKKPFQLDDLQKLVNLSEPKISPDGSRIAVIVSRADWKEDKSKQEIDLVNLADDSIRSITYKREDISHLSWSPDGNSLAFLAKEDETKKPQIYIMPMNGGDAICITVSKTGITEYAWSPDGQKIAFVAQDSVPNPKEIKHHEDAFQVTDNNYTIREAVQPWHLWMVSAKGGDAKQLTKGPKSISTDQETISPIAWNPDGKSVTFQLFPDVWDGNGWHSEIASVDTTGGEVKDIIKDQASAQPGYSPISKTFTFLRPRNGDLNNGNAVYISADGKMTDITDKLSRNITSYTWLADGKSLLLTGDYGTRSIIWKQPVGGNAVRLDIGDIDIDGNSLNVSGNGMITFTGATTTQSRELYVITSEGAKPKQITHLNNFLDSVALGKTESVDWKGPDKFNEDGVLTYPIDYKAGNKYPLVLVIHGGPAGASTIRFNPLVQLFSAKGFFVFQPNYRGSTNLGDAYQHAIYRNTGKGPGEDVMAGLHKIEQMGSIDTNRIGITGWSYGGYMTSWLNGYYPGKWKAAVEGAALNDWVMDYTIAFYQTGDLYFFGGSPWDKKYQDIWRNQSPIVLAGNVKAPTLIMGDVGDPNVPIINSYEMYHALKDNGVNTEFYAYPADTHFPGDIVRTTDVYKRWVDWIVKYVK